MSNPQFTKDSSAVTKRFLPPVPSGSKVVVLQVREQADHSFRYQVLDTDSGSRVWADEEDLELPLLGDQEVARLFEE